MLTAKGKVVWDPGLELLTELFGVLDRHLGQLEEQWQGAGDADALGYFDRMEHATGFGFVACQTYMTSILGVLSIPKATALSAGPRHKAGLTVVEIVNHAANYWKHRDAWQLDRGAAGQERITQAFDAVGFAVDTDYPLGGILAELCNPDIASFAALRGLLVEWRDALRRRAA
jgi:hypothetical protein